MNLLPFNDPELPDDLEEDLEAIAEWGESPPDEHTVQETGQPTLAPEPIFAQLLSRAIDPDDTVLAHYATHVAPRLSARLAHVAAKGGAFALSKRAAGAPAEEVARYGDDQSMRAHIVNGLLPAARVARTLKRWGVQRFVDEFDDETYRLFCAGYTLHDWLKLPEVNEELRALGLEHHTLNVATHLPAVERIICQRCIDLGLDRFLEPIGGLDTHLHHLISIAANTQLQWGVMHNLAALPGLHARGRTLSLATDLATFADYLAYLGRTPVEAASHPAIKRMLDQFDDPRVGVALTYHHLADVRGVITSIINNAAMAAYAVPDQREPLLYAPTGAVYLERRGAPPAPAVEDVAKATVTRIRQLCQPQLSQNLTGFRRDGKGIKYADYYTMFFAPPDLARLVARFAERRITGRPSAGKRYAGIAAKGLAPAGTDLALPDTLEVDRIAETCALLVKIAAEANPALDAEQALLDAMGLTHLRPLFKQLNGDKTGGVPYGWYYAAGMYRRMTPGLDEHQWVERLHDLAKTLANRLPDASPTDAPQWNEIRRYVTDHLRFGPAPPHAAVSDRFGAELARYGKARAHGRGATTVCSLCSSPYQVSEQREAASLFAPMVYTNKQPLHGSKAIRHICAICGAEMMLRQLLMKRGQESGGDFEKRKLRYLYFYPTYFFTPESLKMLRAVHDQLKRVSFTELRKALSDAGDLLHLDGETFQRLETLLLDPLPPAPDADRLFFRLRFPEDEPITFSFIGIPPIVNNAREPKDAEAWITPAFLALLLPLILDVKVIASESLLPIIQEATELPETVAFDGAHAYIGRIVGQARVNLDHVLPALQRLVASYLVHLDGNARTGAGGFDYRWLEIPAVARNLETSPLYAFHYLKKGLRRESGDSIPPQQAARYVHLVEHYLDPENAAMSHARKLVSLYRQFYRHKGGRLNSNRILKPLSEASAVILEADPRLFDNDEALIEAVQGRLSKFLDNVARGSADGTIPRWIPLETRNASLEAFSRYMVEEVYRKAFGGDRAALAGRQLNLLKNACEAIYIDEQRREWRERSEQPDETEDGAAEA
ncbi:MAG: type I-D CRISPR-associated protein Cas10d/Csc3 [Chloroflexaceae bacterium]